MSLLSVWDRPILLSVLTERLSVLVWLCSFLSADEAGRVCVWDAQSVKGMAHLGVLEVSAIIQMGIRASLFAMQYHLRRFFLQFLATIQQFSAFRFSGNFYRFDHENSITVMSILCHNDISRNKLTQCMLQLPACR